MSILPRPGQLLYNLTDAQQQIEQLADGLASNTAQRISHLFKMPKFKRMKNE